MPRSLIEQLDALKKRGFKPDTIARILSNDQWVRGGDFTQALADSFADQHCVIIHPHGTIHHAKQDNWIFWLAGDLERLHGALRDYWFIKADGYYLGSKPKIFEREKK